LASGANIIGITRQSAKMRGRAKSVGEAGQTQIGLNAGIWVSLAPLNRHFKAKFSTAIGLGVYHGCLPYRMSFSCPVIFVTVRSELIPQTHAIFTQSALRFWWKNFKQLFFKN
jgi:hypothetical protein